MSKAPDAIGRYKILNRIGQGGMGVLFLAFDPMLERQIAIKLLRDDNEELRERFAREARSVARLRHPNIVTIFDVGEQDGQPFIAMEYIQGQTLADLVRAAAPIDVTRKLQMIDELCDGLGFAHKIGIVHRDVKPANVMVEHDGVVKILDFGIARIAESGMTQAGMLIGTLNYMSPEQVAGQVVDGRSDIFAVGAVLYEMLAYRQAFPGGLQNGILNKILHGAPDALETVVPGLDAEVIRIVDRALQKDPHARYQDLAAMRKDLQRVKQRLEQNLPETITLAPEEPPETVALEAPTTPARISAQTPRWGTDRDGLAKRRAMQIAAHLEEAGRAMDSGDFDGAVAAAEQALLLHSEEPDALRLLERARVALDDRQVKEWLTRGADLLQEGAHTEALALVEQALSLAPKSTPALELRRAIDRARAEREKTRQRDAAVAAALERGRAAFDRAGFETAMQSAGEALALSPDHAEARALKTRAEEALTRQREAALARQVDDALAQAARLFDDGRHDEAIESLRGSTLDHPRIAAATADLQASAAQIRRDQEAARQRDEQIAAAVARATADSSHEAAVAVLTEALALDSSRADVRSQLEIRQRALDAEREAARRLRQRDETIAAAVARAAGTPSHAAAIAMLEEALALDPSSADLRAQIAARKGALEEEQAEARRVKERQAAIAAAIAKAKRTRPHAAAIAILEEAAALDPAHADVRALLAERRSALDREREDARRLEERRAASDAAVARAAGTPSHEAAVAILTDAAALDPDHAGVREARSARQAALDRERAEARAQREREELSAAALAKAKGAASHDAAIAILSAALARDPGHAALTQALADRRKAVEDEARQQRERQEQIAAALAEAAATPAHAAAIAVLERVQLLDPQHADLRLAIETRRAALERERDEARRARERQEKIAAAIATAKKAAGHDVAIGILNEAQALDPANREIAQLLDTRRAALEQEREQARLVAERQKKVAATLAQAKAAKSHDAAIALLNEALALEPGHREARTLLDARQAALAADRAEAQRLEAIEAARQSVVALIGKQDFDGAERVLQKAEDDLQAKKVLKDLRRQVRDARGAAATAATAQTARPLAGEQASETVTPSAAPSSGMKPATMGIAAAVVVAVAAGGYFMTRTPATDTTTDPPAAVTQPSAPPPGNAATPPASTSSATPSTASPSTAPPGGAPPSSAAPAVKPTPAPVEPAAAPAAPSEAATLPARTNAAIQLARQQLRQGDVRLAWTTVASAAKADTSNRDLRALQTGIVNAARQQAGTARSAALSHGASAAESGPFKSGDQKTVEAGRLLRADRHEQAVFAYVEAADLFVRADREAQARVAASRPAEPAARPNTAPVTPPSNPAPNPPAGGTTPPNPEPVRPAPSPSPTTPPPAATLPPAPKPTPSAPAASDEDGIRATLNAYVAAMTSLDVASVRSVYPGVDAGRLASSFASARSIRLQLEQEQISVNGTEATVRCRANQTFVPKAGNPVTMAPTVTFKLKKESGRWVIVSRS